MPYTIRIRFSGLCAFVPSTVTVGGEEKKVMDVLLVNSGNKNTARLSKKEPHTPVMKFFLKNLTGSNGDVGTAAAWWELEAEDVEFRAVPKAGGDPKKFDEGFQVFLHPKALTSEQPTEDTTLGAESDFDLTQQFHSFSWVPAINDALPGSGFVDPKWISDKLASARIRLDAGSLQSELLGKYGEGLVLTELLPAARPSSGRKALAHWVVLEISDVPDDLDLLMTSKKLSDGTPRRSLTLRSSPGSKGPEIELTVTNLCCGYYINGNEHVAAVPSADDDFELFYTLSQDFSNLSTRIARFPVPTPVSFLVADPNELPQGGGADPVRCTMCQFEGVGS